MINQKKIFEKEVDPNEALLLIMIMTKGLKKNTYSNILTDQLIMDMLFEKDQKYWLNKTQLQ